MSKIALVAGARSGIGLACAQALAKDGWTVVMVGRRADALDKAITDAGVAGKNVLPFPQT